MCIIFATRTRPENPTDAILEVLNSKIFLGGGGGGGMPSDPPKRVCFRMLTFRTLHSTLYVALPVPEQLPYSGYTPGENKTTLIAPLSISTRDKVTLTPP